jgi:hypothetical protein
VHFCNAIEIRTKLAAIRYRNDVPFSNPGLDIHTCRNENFPFSEKLTKRVLPQDSWLEYNQDARITRYKIYYSWGTMDR